MKSRSKTAKKQPKSLAQKRSSIIFVFVTIVAVVLAIQIGATLAQDTSVSPTAGKIVVDNFNAVDQYETSCAALIPTCGYCPGDVIDEQCYLTPAQFVEYQRLYSGLEGKQL